METVSNAAKPGAVGAGACRKRRAIPTLGLAVLSVAWLYQGTNVYIYQDHTGTWHAVECATV